MSLDRVFEWSSIVAATAPSLSVARPQHCSWPLTMGHGVGSTSTTANSPAAPMTSIGRPKFRPLSPDELAEKPKKGECYFCPEKLSQDHNYPMKHVFVMELDDQEDPEVMAEDLGISLHALTDLSGASMMQLMFTIAGTTIQTLVDFGSTHTFIHDAVVDRLGMQITYKPDLSVCIANRERMQSYGACTGMMLPIQGETFQVDCYTLQLEGFDIILGVQRLKSLGLIV
jgi:hypothetical protein